MNASEGGRGNGGEYEEALTALKKQAATAEIVAQSLLGIVAEMVASLDNPYPKTQGRWAGLLLTLLANNPNVQIDRNLRARLEQLRERR